MLVKLMPEQVQEHWVVIKQCVLDTVPEATDGGTDEILRQLVDGNMVAWALLDNTRLIAVIITAISKSFTQGYELIIYSVFGFNDLTDELVDSAFETLKKYGQANECWRIMGETNSNALIKRAEKYGGKLRAILSIDI